MSRYVDLLGFREYRAASGHLGTQDDGLLQLCLDSAESIIDDYTRRNFLGTAGTYYVNRFGQNNVAGQALYLDQDLHTLTALQNGDGQTIPVGSVWLEPRNEGPPYRILRLKSSYVWVWNTDADVIISGTFGYGTVVPGAIVQAVKEYATFLYKLKDVGPTDVAGFPEAGEQPIAKGMPDSVRWKLAPFRSRSGGAV